VTLSRAPSASLLPSVTGSATQTVRMRSGEVRKVHIDCRATIGEVSNEEHSLRQYGKADRTKHRRNKCKLK
jgi:large subunit ribosomal protein L2